MSSDLKDYLYLEAKEKAFEIEIEARKQFQLKKQKIIREETQQLKEKYEKQDTAKETEYKQNRSKLINETRTNKLIARNKALIKLFNHTQIKLLKKCKQNNEFYSELLKSLILEGMLKMMEDEIIVYCLQRDKAIIKEVLKKCSSEY